MNEKQKVIIEIVKHRPLASYEIDFLRDMLKDLKDEKDEKDEKGEDPLWPDNRIEDGVRNIPVPFKCDLQVIDLMRIMRDDYEKVCEELRQQIAELEETCQRFADDIVNQDNY